jgi:hypothetical protein
MERQATDIEEPRVGLDIGRVLIAPGSGPEDTAFFGEDLEQALATPPFPGMFDAVPQLVERFAARVWLVSKCGRRIETRTRQWLEFHRFHDRTGIDPAHVLFCRKRPDKAGICRELRLTHFVDDRPDVLEHMRGVVPNLFLFGLQAQPAEWDWLTKVENWAEVLDRVRP